MSAGMLHTPAGGDTPEVAAVIAFFQHEPGLLARAVRSALRQRGGPVQVVVVDDGSPVRARDDLAGLDPVEMARVTLIEQPNAGPGAARNRALAALGPAIRHVCFLDSDDQWVEDHVERALAAEADFYFTDYIRPDAPESIFSHCGLRAQDHPSRGGDLHEFRGDLFDSLLRCAPVGTSTVVLRRTLCEGVLFPTGFMSGEDIVFWMHAARRARTVAFSTRSGTIYGLGVNIVASVTWGTPASLTRLRDEFVYHSLVADTFELDASQRRWSLAWRRQVASDFVRTLVHLLRHRKPVDWRSVRDFARRRPLLWVAPLGTLRRHPLLVPQPSVAENSRRIASQDSRSASGL